LIATPIAPGPKIAEPDYFSAQITEARRFYLPPPRVRARLGVVCAGREHCAADYHILRDSFPQLSLEFVAAGQGSLCIGGRTHRLLPGHLFAYGPGVAHEIRACPPALAPPAHRLPERAAERALVKYFVGLTGPDAKRLLRAPAPEPGQILQTAAPDDLLQLFELLIAAGLRETPFRDRICSSLAEHLLLRIAESAVPLGTIGSEAFGTYQRCRHDIERHYRTLRGLDEIAQRCRLDPAYICRLFARFDHQSPWQFVLRLKMRDALERLQAPGALVQSVAADLGFPDPFQFSRAFRRVFGLSPREFVRRRRLGQPALSPPATRTGAVS
jgi:AraC-like DNA-binding protein